jgi:hypothetical protein
MPGGLQWRAVPYPDEQRFTLRLPRALRDQLGEAAREDHRSVNEEIVWLVILAIEQRAATLRAFERARELGPQ